MTIKIGLELDLKSCTAFFALRHRYGKEGPFFTYPLGRFVYSLSNMALLRTKLLEIAAPHPPIDMELCNPHRTFGTRMAAVKYEIRSKSLWDLRCDLHQQFADAMVFESVRSKLPELTKQPGAYMEGRTLRYDMLLSPCAYTKPLYVAVQNKITDPDEADWTQEEVKRIDPHTLGPLRAIGLRIKW